MHGLPGKQQQLTGWKPFAHLRYEFQTIEPWHYNIANDKVGRLLCVQRLLSVIKSSSGEPSAAKNRGERVSNRGFVINYEHGHAWIASICPSALGQPSNFPASQLALRPVCCGHLGHRVTSHLRVLQPFINFAAQRKYRPAPIAM